MGVSRRKSNFPVSECVKDCFMKKVQYKSGERENGEKWEAIIFSFVHKDDWINLFIKNPTRKSFDTDAKFEAKKYQTQIAVERILSTYLDSHGMIEFREGLAGIDRNFEAYTNYVANTLESADFKSVKVDLKTMPNERDEAKIMPYGVFIRRSGDMSKVMQYSDWENDIISNLH